MALTKATFAMLDSAPANIKDYGAVGDNSNDDTSAIQAAIAASTNVFFPAGTYKITSSLTIRTGCHWKGEAGTIIEKVGVGGAIVDTTDVNNDAWIIEDLIVRSSAQPAITAGTLGIGMGYSRRSVLRNVSVQFFATGITLDQPNPAIGNYYNSLENVRVYGATTEAEATADNVRGIVLDGANANNFTNCEIYGYNNRGFEIRVVGCNIKGAHVELSKEAIYLDNSASNNNIEVYAEATTGKLGTADAGSEMNNIWVYRDGSGTPFEDNGYNSVQATTGLVERGIVARNGVFQYASTNVSYAAAAGPTAIFKVTLPAFSAGFIDISAIANLPSINNYIENSRYALSYISGSATATNISQTTAGAGAVLTTSVSGNEITFSAVNNASASSDCRIFLAITIQAAGMDSATTANWVKTTLTYLV